MFGSKTSIVKAVEDVSFSLHNDEVLVIAGESGSGKSTIAKLILGAVIPDSGKVIFQGKEIKNNTNSLMKIRMNCQMVHQDPYDSINPRMKVRDIISEPLEIHNIGNNSEQSIRSFPAEVVANQGSYLAFRVNGELLEFPALAGQHVEKDQLLAKLDPEDFQLQYDERKARYELAESQLERVQKLFNRSTICWCIRLYPHAFFTSCYGLEIR